MASQTKPTKLVLGNKRWSQHVDGAGETVSVTDKMAKASLISK